MKYLSKYHNFLIENITIPPNKWITCYHRSNSRILLERIPLKIEFANDQSIFGQALYFASSADISSQLGRYCGKFKIKLINPLNLNDEISNDEANKLLQLFLDKYNMKIDYYDRKLGESVEKYDFNDDYNNVSYGEFFLELMNITDINAPIIAPSYYRDFIQNHLGYDSFYHFSDYGTNFITEKGDYGYCYGLFYDDEKYIKYIETY